MILKVAKMGVIFALYDVQLFDVIPAICAADTRSQTPGNLV